MITQIGNHSAFHQVRKSDILIMVVYRHAHIVKKMPKEKNCLLIESCRKNLIKEIFIAYVCYNNIQTPSHHLSSHFLIITT